ncbi:hypothetical protein FGG08_001065 [Glutinoglossum americanum]|uniref:Uncharacterized protein n=1 Tax=Glutinoglossum americanum TaxID=1670608 RepID=A0A9P8IE79_9PEZI|nr:hypothetical protein FGG08_001065 [Glutinoglossum americanum]
MQFALPPTSRKPSHAQNYTSSFSSRSPARRRRLQLIAILACGAFVVFMLFSRIFSSSPGRPPSGTSEVVLVTVIDDHGFSKEHIEQIKQNRRDYAERHGYTTFLPARADYNLKGAPGGWACVPAMRHALTAFPHSKFFFFLGQNSLIMNPALSLHSHITSSERLESIILRDKPVVPPDSVIKTFAHQNGDDVDLILTQDEEGLGYRSFILRQGEWSRFFLDTWFDPLFRSYNFQKGEAHALEHIVQWHPTILTKLALVPQRILNSYNAVPHGDEENGKFQEGDFIIRFPKCDSGRIPECEKIMNPYLPQKAEEQ